MGLLGDLTGSSGAGGSVNSANSAGWSQSGTYADQARAWSQAAANTAYSNNLAAMREQMAFNAAEAQKQRDWQERMANTVYTRSVANMREAGINPILAANMGLSAAAVGSGATASIGGGGYSPLAQNYMDSWSAAQNASESHGSSWQSSESGLATGLAAMGEFIASALANMNTGMNLNLNFDGLKNLFGGDNPVTQWANSIVEGERQITEDHANGNGYWRNGTWWSRDNSKSNTWNYLSSKIGG